MTFRALCLSTVCALMAAIGGAAAQQKVAIYTPNAPAPVGPHSQAIRAGKFVFLAGQIGINPKTNQLAASIKEQTRLALENLQAVLAADGLAMDDVISTTIFMKDLRAFNEMNEVYAQYFTNAPPAPAIVQVGQLLRDAKVQISAIAIHRELELLQDQGVRR